MCSFVFELANSSPMPSHITAIITVLSGIILAFLISQFYSRFCSRKPPDARGEYLAASTEGDDDDNMDSTHGLKEKDDDWDDFDNSDDEFGRIPIKKVELKSMRR